MMKIAFFALAPFISGAERSLQLTIKSLIKEGVSCVLFCPPTSPMVSWAIAQNIKVYAVSLDIFSWRYSLRYAINQFKILLALKRERVSVLHSNQIWSVPPLQFVKRIFNIPLVSHFRDPIDDSANWWLKDGIDGAVAISSHIFDQLHFYVDKKLIATSIKIINPIELKSISETGRLKVKRALRSKLAVDADSFVFGYVGQISAVKNLEKLLLAFASPEFAEDFLFIAGADPSKGEKYKSKCMEIVGRFGMENRVSWLGHIDNVAEFYSSLNVLLLLSISEPLGRTPLEAASYMVPSIVNNVDGLPETVEHNETGWLVDANDVSCVVNGMLNSKHANLEEMGQSARSYVEKLASPEIYVKQLINFYGTVQGG